MAVKMAKNNSSLSSAANRSRFALALSSLLLLLLTASSVSGQQASGSSSNPNEGKKIVSSDPWGRHIAPRLRIDYLTQKTGTVHTFYGNQSYTEDYFKLLRADGNSLLIGARNTVYNLSLDNLQENLDQRITWPSMERDRELCQIKGKTEDECQNYIRVLAEVDADNLMVCGTNSYNPKCRTYTKDEENGQKLKLHHEFSGKGSCPPDPRHNSTAIFSDGYLYSGTVADLSGTDALIFREGIRTEQYDLKHLNAPDFVSSLEDEHHVYFFFRESAVEYINCGKTVYSRVARVCKGDKGGPHKYRNKWTTFAKARLNCSVPGDSPFYFDEIQSTSRIISKSLNEDLIYAVFTTPENSISGSAICTFSMNEIREAFEGPYKGQRDVYSNWLPTPDHKPLACDVNTNDLTETQLNFIKSHSLVDKSVSNSGLNPGLVKAEFGERFTKIAVDADVRVPATGEAYDVIFVGTTKGRILKFVSGKSDGTPRISEEIQVFPPHIPVSDLELVQISSTGEKRLIVLSNHEVKSLPLNRCSAKGLQNCKSCVALRDPYCAWDVTTQMCVDQRFSAVDATALIQDVDGNGKHEACVNENAILVDEGIEYAEYDLDSEDREDESLDEDNTIEVYSSSRPVSKKFGLGRATSLEDVEDFAETTKTTEILDIEIELNEDGMNGNIDPAQRAYPVSGEYNYSGATLTLTAVFVCIFSILAGFAGGYFTAKKYALKEDNHNKYGSGGHRSSKHHFLENRHNKPDCRTTRSSGYTTPPCAAAANNASSNKLNNIADIPPANHSHQVSIDNNLLKKDDINKKVEKRNVIITASQSSSGSGSSAASTASSTVSSADSPPPLPPTNPPPTLQNVLTNPSSSPLQNVSSPMLQNVSSSQSNYGYATLPLNHHGDTGSATYATLGSTTGTLGKTGTLCRKVYL